MMWYRPKDKAISPVALNINGPKSDRIAKTNTYVDGDMGFVFIYGDDDKIRC